MALLVCDDIKGREVHVLFCPAGGEKVQLLLYEQ